MSTRWSMNRTGADLLDSRQALAAETAEAAAYPLDRCLHEWVEEQVRSGPARPAVRFEGSELSYADLNKRANQCAWYLKQLGVERDHIVAIWMDRSPDMIVALLAVLKAGGVYLPIDPGWPGDRQHFVLEDAQASIVLTQHNYAAPLADFAGTVFCLDSQWSFLEGEAETDLADAAGSPDDLAYIIYTSGSTGKPKGCMIPHKAICNRLLWMQQEYRLTEQDNVLQKTPYTFDVSVWELFWPLIAGACLVVAKPGGHKSPPYLIETICKQQVTVCHFVPSMLRYFIRHSGVGQCRSLRDVFTSGEALSYDLLLEFRSALNCRLHNLYGPTEAAVDVTYWACEERVDGKVPIGRPISNICVRVLSEVLEELPFGEEGELFIGGVGLAKGYLNRPELTAEKFIDDPFRPGGKLYRTGDRAAYLPDGTLDFLGRMDFQVKLRGNRIELQEIESALREHPAIADAVVAVKDNEHNDPKLVAYITSSGEAPEFKEVRQFCKSKLPEYMVPNRVVLLEEFPVSEHGKLDRAALPWQAADAREQEEDDEEKQISRSLTSAVAEQAGVSRERRLPSDAERKQALRRIWEGRIAHAVCQLMEAGEIGAGEDLFDRGATSMTIVQVVDGLEREHGVTVPVEVFLETPTIAGIADFIVSRTEAAADESALFAEAEKEAMPAAVATEADAVADESALSAEADKEATPAAVAMKVGAAAESAGKIALASTGGAGRAYRLPQAELPQFAYAPTSFGGSFGCAGISLARFGRFLSLLKGCSIQGEIKHLYPSAGGIYGVQTYVFVKAGAIEGIDAGLYYYHPLRHALLPLNEPAAIDATRFAAAYRGNFEQAGFGLFLVAHMETIAPVYQEFGPSLVALDAGYMSQLLLSRKTAFGLELGLVHDVDFAGLRDSFRLAPSHKFLLCMLGGNGVTAVETGIHLEKAGNGISFLPAMVSETAAAATAAGPVEELAEGPVKEPAGEMSFADFLKFDPEEVLNRIGRKPEKPAEAAREASAEAGTHAVGKRRALRPVPAGERLLELPAEMFPEHEYTLRASQRQYADQPLSFEQLAKLLLLCRLGTSAGAARYGSDLLAEPSGMEAYLFVKEHAVQGLPAGVYRYDPRRHELHLVNASLSKPLKLSYTPANQKYVQHAAFGLFFVARLERWRAVFHEDSYYYALLEAGSAGQLLMDAQAELGLGLCPIGGMNIQRLRVDFGLSEQHLLLHSFIGGSVERAAEAWQRKWSQPVVGEPCATTGLTPAGAGSPARAGAAPAAQSGIAVIGMSGRYPGADDLEAYWDNLAHGRHSFSPLSEERLRLWGESGRNSSRTPQSSTAGYLTHIDRFDHLLFHLSPAEARAMDPQERQLLQVVWQCLEQAGYTAERLKRQCGAVGVFVGAMWDEYQHQSSPPAADANGGVFATALHSSIANRISYYFDFDGPSLAINTSCSSAMTALHLACESIKRGECQAAIVGGVNLLTHGYHLDTLTRLNLLSKDGECRPFGAQASGWVAGEGVGALLLRPLGDAERYEDGIHGLIRGTAIGHSGRTTRFGAPQAARQADAMRAALAVAGLAAEEIDYVEAAATGAGLADAAEADAIQKVFQGRSAATPCLIGSVKANIGHLESACAMSQVMKVLLQMKHGRIAPTRNAQPVSPLIRLSEAGFAIAHEARPWPERGSGASPNGMQAPKRALINALGATGSGGHLVVEEYHAPAVRRTSGEAQGSPKEIIVLSAASAAQLEELGRRLASCLVRHRELSVADVGFTLRMGRVELAERCAIIADSRDDLLDKLGSWLAGAEDAGNLFRGCVDLHAAVLEEAGYGDAQRICAGWVQGAKVDWSRWNRGCGRTVSLPTYPFAEDAHWVRRTEAAARPAESAPAPAAQMDGPTGDLLAPTEQWLKTVFAEVSEIPASRISVQTPLEQYGLSSLMIQRLNVRLEEQLGELSPTLLFECRTLHELAVCLISRHAEALRGLASLAARPASEQRSGEAVGAAGPQLPQDGRQNPQGLQDSQDLQGPQDRHDREDRQNRPGRQDPQNRQAAGEANKAADGTASDIAIVGLSGQYPKARNVAELWENLKAGVDAISEIPAERWDMHKYYDARKNIPGKTYSKWGGFIDDCDKFDPLFFNISPREAERMDPQERLFLQTAWHTIEDAGYNREELHRRLQGRVGVFVGVMYGEYQLFNEADECQGILSSYGSIANRVSYLLDWHGPSMAVDTLCSSSLTAIHLAAESIRRGECAAALAGGVNLSLHPSKYIAHAQLTMASTDGHCRSFGEGGDGFVPGEGVGAVLLKPLDAAVRDGDHIYAVLKASSLNHGGKTNGYTVPSPVSQGELIADALRKSGIAPETIGYIEAHGTGTSLGDPVEIAGLTRSFAPYTTNRQFCAIGSIKSNIGHLEGAAGIAGVTKILLQMQHGQLVPSLHAERLNPHIRFDTTPFYVQRELAEWPQPMGPEGPQPRRACISSFGAGGAGAHLILEQHMPPQEADRKPAAQPFLFVISAKKEARLREYAQRLLAALQEGCYSDADSADWAYTLRVGREPLEQRLAVVAGSLGEFADKLVRFAAGEVSIPGVYRGNAKDNRDTWGLFADEEELNEMLDKWMLRGKLDKLAELWVKGGPIDWSRYAPDEGARRIGLPGYPFAQERYWLPVRPAQPQSQPQANAEEAMLPTARPSVLPDHPLALSAQRLGSPLMEAAASVIEEAPAVGSAPFPVQAYEEVWEDEVLQRRGPEATASLRTVVCVLNECDQDWRLEEHVRTLAPQVRCVFLAQSFSGSPAVGSAYIGVSGSSASYSAALRSVMDSHGSIDAVWDLTAIDCADRLTDSLSVLQALAVLQAKPRYWMMAAPYTTEEERCYRDAAIGLERSLGQVLPGTQGAVILQAAADASHPAERIQVLLSLLWDEMHAVAVRSAAYEHGTRRVPKLRPVEVRPLATLLRPGATYLITGGMGGIGYVLGEFLARKGARNLILLGRSPLDAEKRERLAALEALGSSAVYLQADVGNRESLGQALEQVGRTFGPIHGVVHAAGTMDAQTLVHKPVAACDKVLSPKIAGTVYLDELLDKQALEFVCCFSSSSAQLGDFGSCDYAVANRFQAAFARYRQQQGATWKMAAINWPIWQDGGMLGSHRERIGLYLAATGQMLLEAEEGLAWFEQLLAQPGAQHLLMKGEPSRIRQLLGLSGAAERQSAVQRADADTGYRSGKAQTDDGSGSEAIPAHGGNNAGPAQALALELELSIESDLKRCIGHILKIPAAELDNEANLAEFGFDSVTLAQLAASLSGHYGIEVTPSLFYGHFTIDMLVRYYAGEHRAELEAFYGRASAPAQGFSAQAEHPAAAIVGSRTGISGQSELCSGAPDAPAAAAVCSAAAKAPTAAAAVSSTVAPAPGAAVSATAAAIAAAAASGAAPAAVPGAVLAAAPAAASSAAPAAASGASLAAAAAAPGAALAPAAAPTPAQHPLLAEPIAIIGISGRFPQADNVEQLWERLSQGLSGIGEIPADRWDWREYWGDPQREPGKSACKWGGFIDGVDQFDPLFFGISPKEAEAIDPQQRLFLEEAWHALEDAGYMGERIRGTSCGVYAGVEESQYGAASGPDNQMNSNQNAVLPARIAYELDLKGPNMAMTAACSSGLVAIHQACMALRQGDCAMALAGGVSLSLSPMVYAGLGKAGMLSADGCNPVFDQHAGGLVPGEAVAVVVLKPLSQAVRDQDRIYGCIKASGVNYNGKTNGLAAPNPLSQAELLRTVYERSGIDPRQVQYVLAHSVGSHQGDPIEVEALGKAFASGRPGSCAIGSVKPLLGHTFAASGVVSLIAMLLAMKHETILQLHGYRTANRYIDWQQTPFYVPDRNLPWRRETGRPRIGAVSTTGINGTNAHIVIEDATADPAARAAAASDRAAGNQLIVLSAKSENRLQAHIQQLLQALQSGAAAGERLPDIAYTLQVGREAMKARLALVAASKQELIDKLEKALAGVPGPETFISTADKHVLSAEELAQLLAASGQAAGLARLGQVWVGGAAIPWQKLQRAEPVRVVSLPGYPFQRRSCWIGKRRSAHAAAVPAPAYENKAAELYSYNARDKSSEFREEYLTFCPFETRVPGFSMSRVFLHPERYPAEAELMRDKQIELRQVLFCKQDWSTVRSLLDIGCGHGTDVIQLAALFPHLRTHGYTITASQAALGNDRIAHRQLGDRAQIFHRDSTKVPFPDRYDSVIGIEVCCHIRDKDALFRNVTDHLHEGGSVLLMDFVANLRGAIYDPNLEIHIATAEDWIDVLSRHGLVVEEAIDVSPQVSNFLHDPEFEHNARQLPEVAQAALRNFANSSISLERKWISYYLFKLRKLGRCDERELHRHNGAQMKRPTPYAQALADMRRSGYDAYPPSKTPQGSLYISKEGS